MVGTKIIVTDELAIAVGRLAEQYRNTAVTIAHDDEYDETEWLVKFDAGYGASTFVVNDQTGEHRIAGLGAGRDL